MRNAGRLFFAPLLLLALPGLAAAEFPSRPITLVVPFPPGAGTDLVARTLAPRLAAAFGQPVVIDNRSGAAGNVGAELVSHAAPDGHTLLYTSSSVALSAAAKASPLDPRRDLTPVAMTVTIPQVLVVGPKMPARTLDELLRAARDKPGSLTFGSGGNGSSLQLAMELLKQRAGVDVTHVPYRGAAPAQLAVMSGEVDMAFLVPALVKAQRDAGKLRAIAVSSRQRSAVLPDVPTVAESGFADYEAMQWHGAFLPPKAPPAVVARWSAELARALADPEVRRRVDAEGGEVVALDAPRFRAAIDAEIRKWGEVVRAAGVKID